MLKGQVFKGQLFEDQIFAIFINTFLNSKNGIINDYKNSMKVTAGNNSVTIQSGAVCIQGRFLEEDTETTIEATTETAFCSLVIEINLDNINTSSEFNQGYYKILKNATNYPALIQDDIAGMNAGIYQFELARFKTSLNGISDFVDLRSYIDYESLYKEIQKKLDSTTDEIVQEVEKKLPIIRDGSIVIYATDSSAAQLFTQEELQKLFGITKGFSTDRISGCVVNGDTKAFSGNCIGMRIESSNHNLYAVLDQTVSGTVGIRVNYTLFYNQ